MILEFNVDAQAHASAATLARLREVGRKFSHLPLLRMLRPIARRALAVAEPPGKLTLRPYPGGQVGPDCPSLTLMSANLWHDWPRYRRMEQRLEAFARLIEREGADVLLLQEVARTPDLRVDEWLADRLGMAYVYSRANGNAEAIGFEEGLVVMSRYTLIQPHLRQLTPDRASFSRRMALGATLATPWGELLAFSVHLSLRRGRNARQLESLHQWVGHLADRRAAFIGGDFNAPEYSPQIARAQRSWLDIFRHLNPRKDGATHTLRTPWGAVLRRERLDYLFLQPGHRDWWLLEARHLGTHDFPYSDHHAVLARLAPVS